MGEEVAPATGPEQTRFLGLLRGIAGAGAAQYYTLLTAVAVLLVTARWLGPEGRGILAAVITWVTLVATFGQLSLGQVAIFRATALRGQEWLGSTLGSLLFMAACVSIGGWLLAGCAYVLTGGSAFHGLPPALLAVGFLNLPGLVCEQYSSSLLLALGRVPVYNRAQLVGRTLTLVLVGLAWFTKLGIAGVLLAGCIGQAIVAGIGLRYLLRVSPKPVRPSAAVLRELLAGGLRLHPNYVGAALITSSSVLIVSHIAGAAATGQFQLALQLVTAILVLPQAAAIVVFGRVASLGPDAAWRDQRKVVVLVTAVVAGVAVAGFALAPQLIPFVFGKRFSPAVEMLQVLLLATIGMSVANAMAPQWIGRGLFGLMSAVTLALGAANIVLLLLLVPSHGAIAAAWSLVGIYAVALIFQLGMAAHCELKYRFEQVG
jgi:O-antigen/teichoic acid export membrane protein